MDMYEILGGSPDSVARELRDFNENAQVLAQKNQGLIEQHPAKWVAVHTGQVRAVGSSIDEVLDGLKTEGLGSSQAIVRYITKEPKTLIL